MDSKKSIISKDNVIGLLFVLPALVGLIVFSYYPIVEAFRISFYRHNGVSGAFIGLSNYVHIIKDDLFWKSFRNVLSMGIMTVAFGLPISLVFASLINHIKVGRNLFKSLFFIPNVISVVAAALVFMFILYPDQSGPMNSLLGRFGLGPYKWFASVEFSQFGVVLLTLWSRVGYNAIIWLAGLQSIPEELNEAANIDGATKLKSWWYITLPSLKPITFFMVIMETILAFRRFGEVYVIGGQDGTPGNSLMTLMLYVYKNSFLLFDFGTGSAASCIIFAIIMLATFLNMKLFGSDAEKSVKRRRIS